MKKLLNTLFVTAEDIYLSLDGENIVASRRGEQVARYPLHTLSGVVSFSYSGASASLMGACAEREIGLAFCTPRGRFLARVSGESSGNVLLRRAQYRMADDPGESCRAARTMIFGKLYNSRWSIERTARDHAMRVNAESLKEASGKLRELLEPTATEVSMESLRGLEGTGAKAYFDVFDEMILNEKETFFFHGRNRRPPLDPVNAMLSFSYSLLSNDCASALESVGLDSYVGFLHRDRPGRASLALDLMEELRAPMADRFVLTQINNRVVSEKDFTRLESGAVLMADDARRSFLKNWQEKKQETLTHPYLKEKLQWGMIPYVQALLLARFIRGDLDEYPPFLWK
ncbi:MAG: type I-C CRISPR-associated endonuclease Cas1c [Oscillospiraceae bacterium]|nr:type I-C CRISPR-associated endonuclease Cas1c [Oscillospiraceae bacterium]